MTETTKKAKKWNFFFDIKEELKKVSWTTKQDLVLCTKIVIGATFGFGLGIYLVDLLIKGSFDALNLLVKWIAH